MWDDRKITPRNTFKKIGYKRGISEELAKSRFRKAYELIIGEKYDKDLWWGYFRKIDPSGIKIGKKTPPNKTKTKNEKDDNDNNSRESDNEDKQSISTEGQHLRMDIYRICENCSDTDCRQEILDVLKTVI